MLPNMGATTQPTRRRFLQTAAAGLATWTSGCSAKQAPPAEPDDPADLIIVGGQVLPMHRLHPTCEALAARGGEVVALGSRAKIEALRGRATRVIDLAGGVAIPGLVDAHGHLVNLGASMEAVELRGASSPQEVVARLRKEAPPDGWIVGRGWDQNLWEPAKMPTHQILTEAFPDRPVWLTRIDGHAGWANEAVLRMSGLTPEVEDPEGGEFLRDPDGALTGVLIDNAMDRVSPPPASRDALIRQITAAQQRALSLGLTGVHEMGVSQVRHAVLKKLAADGALHMRIHAYADRDWFEAALIEQRPAEIRPADRLTLHGAKLYADGALGSRGAALRGPYSDRAGHSGKMLISRTQLTALAERSLTQGWQLATHAIGDRAIRTVLDAYEAALRRTPDRSHRYRIEHCQIINTEDISRFARLGVIASMQPTHATSDMAWVPARVGEGRLAGAYAWKRFLGVGAHVPFGSDFPVESPDPRLGLLAAVTRQRPDGSPSGGWLPDQRVSLTQALRSFTTEAAFAVKREAHLGALAPGMQADVTCLGTDLREVAPLALPEVPITATIVGGQVAYQNT